MSSIGVDFRLKYVETEGKKIKMQIVTDTLLTISGTQQDKRDSAQLQRATTEVPTQ
jgi:hypothetical protein